jgi:hypothetical protein
MSTCHQFFQSSFHFSSLLSVLYQKTNRKQSSLNPLLKTKKSLYVDIALRADLGQWQFTSAKILLSTKRVWNKEGVAWSQKWLPYHLPEGYSGVTGVRRQRQNESNQTLGYSPRRWRRARAYIDITHTLELEHNSLYLSLNTFSSRPFLPILERIFIYDQILQISFSLYNARSFEYFLLSLRI